MPEVVAWAGIGGLAVFIIGMISALSARKRAGELMRKVADAQAIAVRDAISRKDSEVIVGEMNSSLHTAESMAGSGLKNLKDDKFATASGSAR